MRETVLRLAARSTDLIALPRALAVTIGGAAKRSGKQAVCAASVQTCDAFRRVALPAIEAPATSRPTIQIAPRCALLPPVACNMSCSPARPICASSARNSADGSARRRAVRASAAKVGSSAFAERSMVARSRSRCAPLPRRSTSAGFGVSCASSISAVTAKRASCASDGAARTLSAGLSIVPAACKTVARWRADAMRQSTSTSATGSAYAVDLTVPVSLPVSEAARDASSAFASGMASASHSSKTAGAIVTNS